jgi:7-cyano-7-deazaguanine synthase
MNNEFKSGLIATGIHSGTNYIDCTPNFISSLQRVINIYSGGEIILAAPFLNWNKLDIWNYCKIKNVPYKITYSCEMGLKQPCGKCLSCKDLTKLYVS